MPPQILALTPLFLGLADPTRLRILNLLSGGEVCVCHLVTILDMAQPTISRHLAYLRRHGLVTARREGKWMHYAWARHPHPAARAMMESLRSAMAADPAMTRERRRLTQLCCA